MVYYGLGTVGAYLLWYQGVSKVPASTAGAFTGIQPVSAVVLSNLLLKEPMVWSYWLGIRCQDAICQQAQATEIGETRSLGDPRQHRQM